MMQTLQDRFFSQAVAMDVPGPDALVSDYPLPRRARVGGRGAVGSSLRSEEASSIAAMDSVTTFSAGTF